MSASERRQENRELSEAELRIMLEAREQELERERQRMSRKFTHILIVVSLAAIGTFLLFSLVNRTSTHDGPLAATPLPVPATPDPEIPEDLKKFIAKPGDSDLKEDVRFAAQLLNFLNTSDSKPASQPQVESPKSGP